MGYEYGMIMGVSRYVILVFLLLLLFGLINAYVICVRDLFDIGLLSGECVGDVWQALCEHV
jgi:hypothetical protein